MGNVDENPPSYRLRAPGEDGSDRPMRMPAAEEPPALDDHLDPPEITRLERIGGRVIEALPAEPPHAIRHGQLDYVLRAQIVDGYVSASDLKTRFDADSDFASDAAVLKQGNDPATGRRHLEELAFEVVSEQRSRIPREKAARMHRCGVRRIFAIFVKKDQVGEWDPEKNDWRPLDPSAEIDDPCLVEPLPVAALLDAARADDVVASALVRKSNPVIRRLEEESRAAGETAGMARGRAEAILAVLEARGLEVDEALRRTLLETTDLELLDRWLRRAAVADSVAELDARRT